jgi:hypothetical protein
MADETLIEDRLDGRSVVAAALGETSDTDPICGCTTSRPCLPLFASLFNHCTRSTRSTLKVESPMVFAVAEGKESDVCHA